MVMEASPTSSLKVPEPELLFKFLVVPLDAPAQLRERDEAVEGDVFRKGRKPELRGLLLLSWPFDEEPFLVTGNASIEVPVRGANWRWVGGTSKIFSKLRIKRGSSRVITGVPHASGAIGLTGPEG